MKSDPMATGSLMELIQASRPEARQVLLDHKDRKVHRVHRVRKVLPVMPVQMLLQFSTDLTWKLDAGTR